MPSGSDSIPCGRRIEVFSRGTRSQWSKVGCHSSALRRRPTERSKKLMGAAEKLMERSKSWPPLESDFLQ